MSVSIYKMVFSTRYTAKLSIGSTINIHENACRLLKRVDSPPMFTFTNPQSSPSGLEVGHFMLCVESRKAAFTLDNDILVLVSTV
jgi:hypothetical protein